MRQRGRDYTGHMEMSDARLSGDVTVTDNADRCCAGESVQRARSGGHPVGDHRDRERRRDLGRHECRHVGLSADGTGIGYYQLVGTGAYEGLSAVLFETESPGGRPDLGRGHLPRAAAAWRIVDRNRRARLGAGRLKAGVPRLRRRARSRDEAPVRQAAARIV